MQVISYVLNAESSQ